jgi:hypothetical protein
MQKGGKTSNEKLEKEYEDLFRVPYEVIIKTEWVNKGDVFKKFSLYEEYTPVKTSGNTDLNTDF